MKPIILAAALCFTCNWAHAQGTLNFANAAPGVNAPVTDWFGNKLTGSAFCADLYWGPAGTTDTWSLTPLHQPAGFNTGNQAGYFTGGARTIPGFAGGATITVQVRVWRTADGPTWEAGSWSGYFGVSDLVQVTLASPTATPAKLTGLKPFGFVLIPEPSALALFGLGAVVLFLHRRSNSRD